MIELLLQAERAMALGLIDQAEAIYRQLVETDPRNAVAVVGLARVALERRQDRLAYDLTVRALEIDPQDAAALRMEARLSEVLVTRGEAVQRPAFVTPSGGEAGSADAAGQRTAAGDAAPETSNAAGVAPQSASLRSTQPGSAPPGSAPPGSAPLGSAPPEPSPVTQPTLRPTQPQAAPPQRPGLLDRLRRRR